MFEYAYADAGAAGGASSLLSFLPLIIVIVVMYFLMIRPQRKKDKEIQNMRNNLQVGDEIITIGGICGKIVKTKEDTIIVAVGADKVKIEMMKWAVSTVTKQSAVRAEKTQEKEETSEKKKLPKRLKKEEEVAQVVEEVKPVAEETAEVSEN